MNKFSSNTDPKNFGKGNLVLQDWVCVCGTINRKYIVKCLMCNVSRELVKEANGQA